MWESRGFGRSKRFLWASLVCAGVALGASSCATVKPYEREHLADPIMAMQSPIYEDSREMKWMEAREGSAGGIGGAGGGCACN